MVNVMAGLALDEPTGLWLELSDPVPSPPQLSWFSFLHFLLDKRLDVACMWEGGRLCIPN